MDQRAEKIEQFCEKMILFDPLDRPIKCKATKSTNMSEEEEEEVEIPVNYQDIISQLTNL
jgi:hypothetical protein